MSKKTYVQFECFHKNKHGKQCGTKWVPETISKDNENFIIHTCIAYPHQSTTYFFTNDWKQIKDGRRKCGCSKSEKCVKIWNHLPMTNDQFAALKSNPSIFKQKRYNQTKYLQQINEIKKNLKKKELKKKESNNTKKRITKKRNEKKKWVFKNK